MKQVSSLYFILMILRLIILLLIVGCEEPARRGCLDSQACNYDSDARINNNTCIYLDCAGICGGSAVLSGCDNACGSIAVEDCAGTCDGSALLSNGECTNISYTATIQPIFNTNCTGCHGGYGGLTLTSYSDLKSGGNSGDVVIPNNVAESLLIRKLRGTAAGSQMPQNQDPLDETTINLIETWIDEGALEN